jgi:hypothetical protein
VRSFASKSLILPPIDFRGSLTSKTTIFPEIVIIRDFRTGMDAQIEPIDLRSSQMARMTSLDELHK